MLKMTESAVQSRQVREGSLRVEVVKLGQIEESILVHIITYNLRSRETPGISSVLDFNLEPQHKTFWNTKRMTCDPSAVSFRTCLSRDTATSASSTPTSSTSLLCQVRREEYQLRLTEIIFREAHLSRPGGHSQSTIQANLNLLVNCSDISPQIQIRIDKQKLCWRSTSIFIISLIINNWLR